MTHPGDRPRVAVDAAGGDAGPEPVIAGALAATDTCDVLLVGPGRVLGRTVGEVPPPGVTLRHAPEVVGMDEDPVAATRAKRRSSLMVAAAAVAAGEAVAMVSPGNTGAAVLAATVRLRRLAGLGNPALAVLLPAPDAGPTVLLDVGATTTCPPQWLAQFAVLGSVYASVRLGVPRPRVGLLSNGHEDCKGDPVRRQAHAALRSRPGYVGQVEAYELMTGRVDVVVTDGFSGDMVMKTYERTLDATAGIALDTLRREPAPDGDRLADTVAAAVRSRLAAEPGAVLLGLRGTCVVCHGAADAGDVAAAVRIAARCGALDLPGRTAAALRRAAPQRRPGAAV